MSLAIICLNASSRSICCELAMQITTNRMSASSMAIEPGASSGFLRLRTELVTHLAGQLTHFLGETRDVRERGEISLLELSHPLIDGLLRLAKTHV